MGNSISVVINTLNEEMNLPNALESVRNLADEIIVVDMYSDDRTVEIARQYGAKVFYHERVGFVEPARQYAVSLATNEWILVLDADERVTFELAQEIKQAIKKDSYLVYRIDRRDVMFGKWINYGGWDKQYNIRLHKKGSVKWTDQIHQQGIAKYPVGDLQHLMLHYSHTTIEKFTNKMNQYTTIEAQELYEKNVKIGWFRILRTIPGHFFQRYILWQGFRDGAHGFVLAVLIGVYHFLTRVKLWELYYIANRVSIAESEIENK